MVVALAGLTGVGGQIGRRFRDGGERQSVGRVEDGEGPVRPVDLDGEVVPRTEDERGLEQHVQRVVAHFEEVGV